MAAAAVVAEHPSSAKEEDLLSPSPSPSPSPSRSPSSPAAASAATKAASNGASSPDPDPSSPAKGADLAAPPPPVPILPRILLPQASLPAANHPPSSRRLPPPCWTQEETDALIQSYRQKWYALRRGNLRASHWEEVADAVERRCRHLYTTGGGNTPKTAVQCRHKMEKLRKRYRSEKKRPHRTSWVHFRDMDAMEMGTPAAGCDGAAAALGSSRSKAAAAAAAAAAADAYSDDDNDDDESDDEGDDDDDDDDRDDDEEEDGLKNSGGNASTRSIHALMSKANGVSPIGDLRFQIPKAVRSKVGIPRADDRVNAPSNNAFNPTSYNASASNGFFKGFSDGLARKRPPSLVDKIRMRMEERRRKEREEAGLGEMVAAVRMLGDGFMRVEEMKMEMAREMEKLRMEMELKRTEMILETQRWIVDAFVKELGHGKKKKAKTAPES